MAKHDSDPVLKQLVHAINESGQAAVPVTVSAHGTLLTGALIAERRYFSRTRRGKPLMSALEPSSGLLGKEYVKETEAESGHHLHIRTAPGRTARSPRACGGSAWKPSTAGAWARAPRRRRGRPGPVRPPPRQPLTGPARPWPQRSPSTRWAARRGCASHLPRPPHGHQARHGHQDSPGTGPAATTTMEHRSGQNNGDAPSSWSGPGPRGRRDVTWRPESTTRPATRYSWAQRASRWPVSTCRALAWAPG